MVYGAVPGAASAVGAGPRGEPMDLECDIAARVRIGGGAASPMPGVRSGPSYPWPAGGSEPHRRASSRDASVAGRSSWPRPRWVSCERREPPSRRGAKPLSATPMSGRCASDAFEDSVVRQSHGCRDSPPSRAAVAPWIGGCPRTVLPRRRQPATWPLTG